MSLPNLFRRTKMLIQHHLHTARQAAVSRGFEQTVQLMQLEERILFSASAIAPLAAEVAEVTSAMFATVDDLGTVDQIGLSDGQLLDLVADSVLPTGRGAQVSAHFAASAPETLELVFLDSSLQSLEQIKADLRAENDSDPSRRLEFVVLDSSKDGIAQITAALIQYNGVDGMHIVSHGSDGQVQLGSTTLSLENLDRYRSAISAWQYSMSEEADILIYGCNVAESADGQELLNQLSQLTATDVAASENLTGHADLGGDWELEYTVGIVESQVAFSSEVQASWQFVLATGDSDQNVIEGTSADDSHHGAGESDVVSGAVDLLGAVGNFNSVTSARQLAVTGTSGAWTVTQNNVDFLENGFSGLVVPQGGRAVDLNGNAGFGAIQTTLVTEIGQQYAVTFFQSSISPGTTSLTVAAAGTSATSSFIQPSGTTHANMPWEAKSFTFTATDTTTTLSFTSNSGTTNQGPYLAAVRLFETNTADRNDMLIGGSGGDTLVGGGGDDLLIGDTDEDLASQFATAVQPYVLVGNWTFDETSGQPQDSSGQGNHATLFNGASLLADGPFPNSGAVSFDGVDDYVLINDAIIFDQGAASVGLWFKADDVNGSQALFSRDSAGFDGGGHLTITVENGGMLQVRHQSTSDEIYLNSLGNDVKAGQWHHLVYTWNGTGTELFLDGVLVDTAGGRTTVGNNEPIVLGASQDASGDGVADNLHSFFDGSISKFTFFDAKLSSAQVADMFAASQAESRLDNLLVNGSFEVLGTLPRPAAGDFSIAAAGSGNLTGWTITGGSIDVHEANHGAFLTTDGNYNIDMNQSTISQTVSGLTAGERLSFTFDARMLELGAGETLQVYWGGTLVGTIDTSPNAWTQYSFDLIAGSGNGSNTLTLTDTEANFGVRGTLLDNLRLTRDADDTLVAGAGQDELFGGASTDATSTLVAYENFELGASGWSNNMTNNTDPDFSQYLGQFDSGAGIVEKTFTLPSGQDAAVIEFDMYRIDSWDNERFQVYINDVRVIDTPFVIGGVNAGLRSGELGGVKWTMEPITDGATSLGYASWQDQQVHFKLVIEDPSTSIKLGFTSTLDQAVEDEAWGVDNVRIATLNASGITGDLLDGGNGKDIATFQGRYAEYALLDNGNGTHTLIDSTQGRDGVDTLSDVEVLQFADGYYTVASGEFTLLSPVYAVAEDATGSAGVVLPLNLDADTYDANDAGTLRVEISGLRAGTVLSDGVNSYSAPSNGATADISGWDLQNLTIQTLSAGTDNLTLAVTRVGDVSTGLAAGYDFEEGSGSAVGSITGLDNGTTVGSPTLVTGHDGTGTAMQFGTNNYVVIPDSSRLDLGNTLSLATWVRVDSLGSLQAIFSKGDEGNDDSYGLYVEADGRVALRMISHQDRFSRSETTLTAGQWHHVAITNDGTTTQVYIDGRLDIAYDSFRSTSVNDAILTLGASLWGIDEFLNGALDEVRIYNRVLSEDDVAQLADNPQADSDAFTVTTAQSAPTDLQTTSTDGGGLSINNDGGNDVYLQADTSPFSGNGQVTVEVDFQVDSPATGLTTLLSYATGTNQDELYIGIDSGGEVFFRTSSNSGPGYGSTTHAPQLLDGNRHTLSVTWNSTGGILMFYVDGEQLGLGRNSYQTGSTIDAGGTLVIGQHQTAPGSGFVSSDTFEGTIYNARIFSDLRTASEIAASYRSELPYDEVGMLAQWEFDNLSSDGVITETVSGNNLTVKHTTEPGFTASEASLTFAVDENALDGTLVGQLYGIDAEREAQIASLLAADPDLRYNAETGSFYKIITSGAMDKNAATIIVNSTTLNGVLGTLPTITSASENEFVRQLVSLAGTTSVWLSGSDSAVADEWRWADGTLFWVGDSTGYRVDGQYANFSATEPNGGANATITSSSINGSSGLWQDSSIFLVNTGLIIEYNADAVLDTTNTLTYSIQSQSVAGAFEIDADTGEIRVAEVAIPFCV